MADLAQIAAALRAADAAGNEEDARRLAQAYAQAQAQQQPAADFSNVQHGGQPTVSGRDPATYNLTGTPGVSSQLGGVLDAAQHHTLNLPLGIAQLAGHGLNSAVQAIAPNTDFARNMQTQLSAEDAAVRQREADYQARTAGNAGSYIGAAAGEVLPWMTGIGELRAAGMLPKVAKGEGFLGKLTEYAKKAGLLSAEGGIMGATQPVAADGSYGAQKAAQVGVGAVAAPVIGAAVGGTGALVGGVRNSFSPASRLARLYGLTEADVATLRNANPGVPGVTLTAAQALQRPEAVAAERVLRNRGPSAPIFASADSANNKAMLGEAQRIAGGPEDMKAAVKARADATDPYWASLPGKPAPAASILAKIEATSKTGLGQGDRVQGALGKLKAAIEKQVGEGGNIDADVLKGIRENFRSYFDHKPTGKELKALEPVADEIASVLESSVPGYRASVASFRDLSRPINDMEAGRELVAAINRGGRDAGGNQVASLSKLESLLAKNARGKFPMTPATRSRIEAMVEARKAQSVSNNTVAASGPGTAADAGRGLAGKLLPTILSAGAGSLGGLPGFAAGLGAAGTYHLADAAATSRLARLAANSQLSADAFEALMRRRGNPLQLQASPYAALLPYQQ